MTSYIGLSMQKVPEYTVFIKKLTSYINEKTASKQSWKNAPVYLIDTKNGLPPSIDVDAKAASVYRYSCKIACIYIYVKTVYVY